MKTHVLEFYQGQENGYCEIKWRQWVAILWSKLKLQRQSCSFWLFVQNDPIDLRGCKRPLNSQLPPQTRISSYSIMKYRVGTFRLPPLVRSSPPHVVYKINTRRMILPPPCNRPFLLWCAIFIWTRTSGSLKVSDWAILEDIFLFLVVWIMETWTPKKTELSNMIIWYQICRSSPRCWIEVLLMVGLYYKTCR